MYETDNPAVWIGRVLVLLVVVGGIALFLLRKRGRSAVFSPAAVGAAFQTLRAGFAQTRSPVEAEPVCVVASRASGLGAQLVVVGVTNARVLVVVNGAPMQAFPYDAEGEHFSSNIKKAQKRGFFDWYHDPKIGYCPKVKVPPFAGETWVMPLSVPAHPHQFAALREFANRFYFEWFYG